MSRIAWEARFDAWARPLSATEDEKCENAISVARKAIEANPFLQALPNLHIFAQGSYKANTNVRADSDVDINVCNRDHFFCQYPLGWDDARAGNVTSSLPFATYKTHIEAAVNARYGSDVSKGDKSFRIQGNTYRINTDIVPSYEFRLYRVQGSSLIYDSGVAFISQNGTRIVNWPAQTLANGIAKNNQTGMRYKKVVRVLKGLRNELKDRGNTNTAAVSSFMIESLAWNVANNKYGNDYLYDDVKEVISDAWYWTYDETRSRPLKEVNDIKDLFSPENLLKRQQISAFFWDLQAYIGART